MKSSISRTLLTKRSIPSSGSAKSEEAGITSFHCPFQTDLPIKREFVNSSGTRLKNKVASSTARKGWCLRGRKNGSPGVGKLVFASAPTPPISNGNGKAWSSTLKDLTRLGRPSIGGVRILSTPVGIRYTRGVALRALSPVCELIP